METSLQTFLIPYLLSNVAAVLLALCSWKWPLISRLLYALLFAGACWLNLTTSIHTPEAYLFFAEYAILPVYQSFITGLFQAHITLFVSAIAIGQGLIALSILMKGIVFRIGCIGAIVFLISIAPLGIGAAFPSSLTMAGGIWLLLHHVPSRFIWQIPLLAEKRFHEKTI